MIPPDKGIEESYEHILTYTFLETSVRSKCPKRSAFSLGSN